MDPITIGIGLVALAGAAWFGTSKPTAPAGVSSIPAANTPVSPPKAPPKPPAKKRCEPADTWFEETTGELLKESPAPANETPKEAAERKAKAGAKQKAHGVTEKQWHALSCNEKKQVMLLGPVALTTILIGRSADEAKKHLKKAVDSADDAKKDVLKSVNSAAKKATGGFF